MSTSAAGAAVAPTRAEINRANSQFSTGPTTDAGKQRSKLNAIRHGLTGQTIVLPSEDLAAYQSHSQRYASQFHPRGVLEEQLVQILTDTTWRLNRIAAIENNLLTLGMTEYEGPQDELAMAASFRGQAKAIAALGMHEQRLSRQLDRTLKTTPPDPGRAPGSRQEKRNYQQTWLRFFKPTNQSCRTPTGHPPRSFTEPRP